MLRIALTVGFVLVLLPLKAQHEGTKDSALATIHQQLIAIESLFVLPAIYIKQGSILYGFDLIQQDTNRLNILENNILDIQIELPHYFKSSYAHTIRTARIKEWIEQEFIKIEKPIAGFTLVRPVYFDFDSELIRNDASVELDKLVKIMLDCPSITVVIIAHTDQKGTSRYNKQLGKKRGRSVAKYLMDNGLAEERLIIRTSRADIVDQQDWQGVLSDEKRDQMNRRAEFTLKIAKSDSPSP